MAHNCSSAIKDTARIQNAIANFCALYLSTGFTLKQNHSDNPNPKGATPCIFWGLGCQNDFVSQGMSIKHMVEGEHKQSQLGVCGGGL